ncbi:hypothetical protein FGB62_312g09 [Gracilaria domingensis]|nr:hypothetical protein FGB62_312g09 [Gracilaria domingensis]
MCVSGVDCDQGEDCAESRGGIRLCASIRFLREQGMSQGLSPVPSPSGDPKPAVFGFNMEVCSEDSQCIGVRQCITADRAAAQGRRLHRNELLAASAAGPAALRAAAAGARAVRRQRQLRDRRAHGVAPRAADDDEDVLPTARLRAARDGGEQPALPPRDAGGVQDARAGVHRGGGALRVGRGGAAAAPRRANRTVVAALTAGAASV